LIRVCRYLYINPLTVAFFIMCRFTGRLEYFIISYLSMLLHECFHMIAAVFIGLKISSVSLHPFGVNLRLKNTLVYSIADEMILYLSGPLCNLLLSLAVSLFFAENRFSNYAFAVNIMLFFVNMLPVYPLDGGCILKRVLIYFLGENVAVKVITAGSSAVAACLLAAGIYAVFVTDGNYSVIFLSVLCIANIFTVREKYSQDAVRNLVFSGKNQMKSGTKVNLYSVRKDEDYIKLVRLFRPGRYTCFVEIDSGGKICSAVTEEEIRERLISNTK